MTRQLKTTCVALAGVAILTVGGCFRVAPVASAPDPLVTPAKTPPWAESYGQFYTKDIARAQQEIPFPIVLPRYIPRSPKGIATPSVEGPLRKYQLDGKVEIGVLYIINPGEKVVGSVEIRERNYPVLPPAPELNPRMVYTDIRGRKMVKTEGNFAQGRGVVYYFSRDNIYFDVGVYNLPAEEALKVVESMLE